MALLQTHGSPPPDAPDSLQDLCVCYCVNHLDVLTESLNSLENDGMSSFSLLLGNRMLFHCLQNSILTDLSQRHFDMLLQNDKVCNSFRLARRYFFSLDNIHELAHNKIQNLAVSCFDENNDLKEGLECLIENNLGKLRSLRLNIHTDNVAQVLALLHTLVPGLYREQDNEDETKPTGCFNILNKKFHITAMHRRHEDTKESHQSTSEKPVCEQTHQSPNLKSIAVSACDLSMESSQTDYDAIFACVDQVLVCNTQLQSVTVVATRLNPTPSVLTPQFGNLQSLILSCSRHGSLAVTDKQYMFANIACLQQLKHLDLSFAADITPPVQLRYSDTDVDTFIQAVKNMPQLKSLDVSGTNLSKIIGHAGDVESDCGNHCMPGFEGRVFSYLGLFNSDACTHKSIPALKVSGTANEEQLLTAVWSFHHNPAMMKIVLDEVKLHIQVKGNLQNPWSLIQALISYMENIGDWDLRYWLAKKLLGNITTLLLILYHLRCVPPTQQRRALLERFLILVSNCVRDLNLGFDVIASHTNLSYIVRTTMVLMLYWNLENIAVYCHMFEQYCHVLKETIVSRAKLNTKMMALRLMHSACRMSQELKQMLGTKLQLIKFLLDEVQPYNSSNNEMVEKMWSILWTLTDEAPLNCDMFVKHSGCIIGKAYIEKSLFNAMFQNVKNHDLHRKITGAMSNVSENVHLRPHLMNEDLVQLFRKLLSVYTEDDEDISSHAASFLVLLASDSPEKWTLTEPTRDQVLQEVDDTIVKWNISVSKGVRYRSLRPMLNQIGNYTSPTAQMWGAWIIDNLVITRPSLYCDMFEEEGGPAVLENAMERSDMRCNTYDLLMSIRECVTAFRNRSQADDSD